jgi:hypothetical protein
MGTMYSTHGYYSAAGYYGYCIVPTGTAVVPTGTTVLRVLPIVSIVPKTGYYRVLQAYAAEGMGRVRVRLMVCTPPPTRCVMFLRVISIKMARAFAESVIGLMGCGFNKSSEGKGKR